MCRKNLYMHLWPQVVDVSTECVTQRKRNLHSNWQNLQPPLLLPSLEKPRLSIATLRANPIWIFSPLTSGSPFTSCCWTTNPTRAPTVVLLENSDSSSLIRIPPASFLKLLIRLNPAFLNPKRLLLGLWDSVVWQFLSYLSATRRKWFLSYIIVEGEESLCVFDGAFFAIDCTFASQYPILHRQSCVLLLKKSLSENLRPQVKNNKIALLDFFLCNPLAAHKSPRPRL